MEIKTYVNNMIKENNKLEERMYHIFKLAGMMEISIYKRALSIDDMKTVKKAWNWYVWQNKDKVPDIKEAGKYLLIDIVTIDRTGEVDLEEAIINTGEKMKKYTKKGGDNKQKLQIKTEVMELMVRILHIEFLFAGMIYILPHFSNIDSHYEIEGERLNSCVSSNDIKHMLKSTRNILINLIMDKYRKEYTSMRLEMTIVFKNYATCFLPIYDFLNMQ